MNESIRLAESKSGSDTERPEKPRSKAKFDNAERPIICYNINDYTQTERQIVRGANMHR